MYLSARISIDDIPEEYFETFDTRQGKKRFLRLHIYKNFERKPQLTKKGKTIYLSHDLFAIPPKGSGQNKRLLSPVITQLSPSDRMKLEDRPIYAKQKGYMELFLDESANEKIQEEVGQTLKTIKSKKQKQNLKDGLADIRQELQVNQYTPISENDLF